MSVTDDPHPAATTDEPAPAATDARVSALGDARPPAAVSDERVPAASDLQTLSVSQRRLLSDLFAIVSEHAADSAVPIDRARVQDAFVFSCEHHGCPAAQVR